MGDTQHWNHWWWRSMDSGCSITWRTDRQSIASTRQGPKMRQPNFSCFFFPMWFWFFKYVCMYVCMYIYLYLIWWYIYIHMHICVYVYMSFSVATLKITLFVIFLVQTRRLFGNVCNICLAWCRLYGLLSLLSIQLAQKKVLVMDGNQR